MGWMTETVGCYSNYNVGKPYGVPLAKDQRVATFSCFDKLIRVERSNATGLWASMAGPGSTSQIVSVTA